ncbi:MAG: uroporphyrinogen-III synthase [Acidiferrobacterales bacterium]
MCTVVPMVRTNGDLTNLRVLVTRPSHQAEHLANLIEAQGGQAVRVPTIEILPPNDPAALATCVNRLHEFNMAIFISANAVHKGMELITACHGSFPDNVAVACVGLSSARELQRFAIPAIVPTTRFDTEGLLALPELQQVKNKAIVIFRGEGGRELLGRTLTERGAYIEYAECYRRVKPSRASTAPLQSWESAKIDIVTTTSIDGLRNLVELVGKIQRKALTKTPIVVISQRMADVSHELGFEADILVATQASDEAIVEAIKMWHRS